MCLLVCVFWLVACGQQEARPQATPDEELPEGATPFDSVEVVHTGSSTSGATEPTTETESTLPTGSTGHTGLWSTGDTGGHLGFVPPAMLLAERIAVEEEGAPTPATWNAHLPKLTGDGTHLYAVHGFAADAFAERRATVLSRPAAGGPWSTWLSIDHPVQPPGVTIDNAGRLHVLFACIEDGSGTDCVEGIAPDGLSYRFVHLVFSARAPDGLLRSDRFANIETFSADTYGYMGLGTTPEGSTWWSLVDLEWNRVVQAMGADGSTWKVDTLSSPEGYLLYPVLGAGAAGWVHHVGVFDPSGGDSAAYPAALTHHTTGTGLALLAEHRPVVEPPAGSLAAFPSDVAFDLDDALLTLTYLDEGDGRCSSLHRYDAGIGAAPTVIEVGCFDNYAQLQVSSTGTYYVLEGTGSTDLRIAWSTDRGVHWQHADVPVVGIDPRDVTLYGWTALKSYTAPLAYEPDRMVFMFSGIDAKGVARNSYFGSLELQ
jgi:hypothetical protein